MDFDECLAGLRSPRRIDTVAKAQLFIHDGQQLTYDWWLGLSENEFTSVHETDPIRGWTLDPRGWPRVRTRKVRIAWITKLAKITAHVHFCRTIDRPRTSNVLVVGRSKDVRVFEVIFMTLQSALDKIANHAMTAKRWELLRSGPEPPPLCYARAKGYRKFFLNDVIMRFSARYDRMRTDTLMSTALAHNRILILEKAIDNYIKDNKT